MWNRRGFGCASLRDRIPCAPAIPDSRCQGGDIFGHPGHARQRSALWLARGRKRPGRYGGAMAKTLRKERQAKIEDPVLAQSHEMAA